MIIKSLKILNNRRVYVISYRCEMLQKLSEGGTICFQKTGTNVAIFMYGTNSGLTRLELIVVECCGAAF